MNLPTFLTWLRIAAIPLLVLLFYLPVPWAWPAAAMLFALAALTDALDGYLARRLNQQSRFGAFLDPVADKLIVAAALILLVHEHGDIAMTVAAVVIVGREIVISALREWMAEVGARAAVAVSSLGKIKTIAQMIALICLLYHQPLWGLPVFEIGYWLLLLAAALTVLSAFFYLRAASVALKT